MRTPLYALAPAVLALGLAACGAGGGGASAASPGQRLYLQYCIACHQKNGEGVPGVQPPLAGTPVTVGDPGTLAAWVMYGVRPASLPKGQYAGVMPQFAYLPDDELATLLSYVRASFGNAAPAVGAATIAQVRAAHRR